MSKISVNKKIGNTTFTFWAEDEDFKEAFAEAAFYGGVPDKCGICGGEEVKLDSNRTQEGYLYIKVKCLNEDCRAAATLGIYKDNKGGFWKKFEKYEPKESNNEEPTEKTTKPEKVTKKEEKSEDDEGYPF